MKIKLVIGMMALSLFSCSGAQHKFRIRSADGRSYFTDSITKDGDCITFMNDCGCGGDSSESVTLCGSYTIVKTNTEK